MTFATLQEAAEALETHRPEWSAIVRERLREAFSRLPVVHADDLGDDIPQAVRRGVVGAQFGALVKAGLIVEVGRRKSSRPEAHGRKSGVFELTDRGRKRLAGVGAGVASPQGSPGALKVVPLRASTDPGHDAVRLPVPGAADPASGLGCRKDQGGGGGHDPAVPAAPTLFDVQDGPRPQGRPGYMDADL